MTLTVHPPISTSALADPSDGKTPQGLAELYRLHAPGAVRLAYLLTGDRAAAKDIAQDAFVQAASRRSSLRSTASFPAYLRKTVVRCVYMRQRANIREQHRVLRAEHLRTPDPGDFSARSEMSIDVMRALRVLPPRQRAAIVLRYWEDLPEQEIAVILRCRPGTVKSAVSRGLETLRKELTHV